MNNFEQKRQEIKERTYAIIKNDNREESLETLLHNYSKEKKIQKERMTKSEFFKEKEKLI